MSSKRGYISIRRCCLSKGIPLDHKFSKEDIDSGKEINKSMVLNIRKSPYKLVFNISPLTGIIIGIETPIGEFVNDIVINVNHNNEFVITSFRSYKIEDNAFSKQASFHAFIFLIMEFLDFIESSESIKSAVIHNYNLCFQLDIDKMVKECNLSG